MYRLVNIPEARSGVAITCEVEEDAFHLKGMYGSTMGRIYRTTDSMIASDIARAVTLARDIGYQHALADIRKTLGIKE